MTRRELMLVLASSMAAARMLRAQQKAMLVIGFLSALSPGPAAPFAAGVRRGLSETGYVEGQNVTIEYRWAEDHYDRLPALAADLVGRKVDVILASGGDASAFAAKGATSTIPIVFAVGGDPVERGLVASLSRPGGNLTGISVLAAALNPKRLELLSELVPQARVVALLVKLQQSECRARDARRAGSGACEGGAARYPEGRNRSRDRCRLRSARAASYRRASRCRRAFQPARAACGAGGTLFRSGDL
jgi:putative ABC transport system substrate-binding protein